MTFKRRVVYIERLGVTRSAPHYTNIHFFTGEEPLTHDALDPELYVPCARDLVAAAIQVNTHHSAW
jgi:hypothetical protein